MPEPSDVFSAIADPKRRQMIDTLASSDSALNLNALSERFAISRQAVRKHIRVLQDAGLIVLEKQGRDRYCQVNLQPLQAVHQWTALYQQFWTEKLQALEKYLDEP